MQARDQIEQRDRRGRPAPCAQSGAEVLHGPGPQQPGLGVHLDPVNLISCDRDYYRSADLLRRCFSDFGPRIRSCHAKDVIRLPGFLPHYEETRPGLGRLDYAAYVRLIDKLDPDLPLMIEHLDTDAEYDLAAAYIRSCAHG